MSTNSAGGTGPAGAEAPANAFSRFLGAGPGLPVDLYGTVGMEVSAVLRAAHDAALEMTQRAEEDAQRTRDQAEEDARRRRAQVEEEVTRIRAQAEEESRRLRAQLDEEVTWLRSQAEEDAHEVRLQAEEQANRLRAKAEEDIRAEQEGARARLQSSLERFSVERVAGMRSLLDRLRADQQRLQGEIEAACSWLRDELRLPGEPPGGDGTGTGTVPPPAGG